MGQEVFLQSLQETQDHPVATSDILRCFAGFIVATDDRWIDLEFGHEGSCSVYFDTTAETNTGIMVGRPCGCRSLYECLFAVMQLGNFVQIVPGANDIVVVNEEAIPHLPPDMGTPTVTKTLEEYIAWWQSC